jgi:hypothetical protein
MCIHATERERLAFVGAGFAKQVVSEAAVVGMIVPNAHTIRGTVTFEGILGFNRLDS